MTAYEVSISELGLYDRHSTDGHSLHYERDHDLIVNTKAASRGGEVAALLLVELGIDGNECHQVRMDVHPILDDDAFSYSLGGDEVRILSDAIDVLTDLRDNLSRMTQSGQVEA